VISRVCHAATIQCRIALALRSACEKHMHDRDQFEQDQAALAIYRRTLAYCLDEQAKFGARSLLPSLTQSMVEARENIQHIKAHLRARGIAVADWPNDGSALPIEHKESLDPSAASRGDLPKTGAAPHASAPSSELPLDAGVPTDLIEDLDQEREAGESSEERATIAIAALPPAPAPAPSDEPQLAAIPILPGYAMYELVAQAAPVRVYHGTELRFNRSVLVYVLHVTDDTVAHRFESSRHVLLQLSHPNLLPILEIGRDERLGAYLVTQYVEARSLQDVLKRSPLDPLLALRVCGQIGAALDALHAHGVVHGNVQPALILMTPDGRAYLTGVPLVVPGDAADLISPTVSNDATIETPLALPITPAPPTPTDDLAGLGMLLDQMLRGEPPAPDQDSTPPVAADPTLAGVDPVIRALRAPGATQRYASAEQALAALRQAFPQQVVELADYLQAASWHSAARWLENPLEAALGDLLAEAFLTRSRARANALHRVGAIPQLLEQRRARHWLRRTLPGQRMQPHQIVSYNFYCYELRIQYETRAAPQTREHVIGDGTSVPERTSPDLWMIAVPYVEPFVDVLPGQLSTAYVTPCATCRGMTELICSACAGKGVIERVRWITYDDGTTSATTDREPCAACHAHGRLRCVRCAGVGQLRYEQTFTWSRRGRIYFNEDDLNGLQRRTVARHAQQVFRSAVDPYDPRWYQIAPLRELFAAAVSGGGPDSRPVTAEFIIRSVPISDVDYVAGRRIRSLTLIGFENELYAG
jgi:serine/threonine protein kinase